MCLTTTVGNRGQRVGIENARLLTSTTQAGGKDAIGLNVLAATVVHAMSRSKRSSQNNGTASPC